MLGKQRYQQEVLSALLKWTLIVGPPAGLLNMLLSIGDPAWTAWAGSGGVLALSLITWWCIKQTRQGKTLRAARIYIVSGMCVMTVVVATAAQSEVVLGAMGLSIFLAVATFFEPRGTSLYWGVAGSIFYEAGLAARLLTRMNDTSPLIDKLSLYLVPPVILMFFAIIGRIMTHHLLDALTKSEEARRSLALSYAEVEQRVEERTHDLAIARDQAEAASRAKSTFLATMSHELRTPLTAILGYSALIEHEAQMLGYTRIVSDLGSVTAAGEHLLALISNILHLAEIEAGKVGVYRRPCDVEALVNDAVATIRPLAEKNRNVVYVDYRDDLGVRLLDQAKVQQMLLNLLSNAAKFTEQGTITLIAAGGDGAEANWITFQVADTGIGISPDDLQQLFQPFTKGESAIKRMDGGTGLGLTVCHRFCQLLGGDITVTSVVGEGSSFIVRLPAEIAPQPATPISQ
jgi:signal transduction histidine kinase